MPNIAPTDKQLSYAHGIAKHLKITLHEELLCRNACSKFIETHQERYKAYMQQRSILKDDIGRRVTQAYRVERWLIAENMVSNNEPFEEISSVLNIKLPSTIDKYLKQLKYWREENQDNEEYKWVMGLVVMLLNGEDIEKVRELKYTI